MIADLLSNCFQTLMVHTKPVCWVIVYFLFCVCCIRYYLLFFVVNLLRNHVTLFVVVNILLPNINNWIFISKSFLDINASYQTSVLGYYLYVICCVLYQILIVVFRSQSATKPHSNVTFFVVVNILIMKVDNFRFTSKLFLGINGSYQTSVLSYYLYIICCVLYHILIVVFRSQSAKKSNSNIHFSQSLIF